MIVVTGGAGFIGSNLVRALNRRGVSEVLIVDSAPDGSAKAHNLRGLQFVELQDKQTFRRRMEQGAPGLQISGVLHQGACTDTMNLDPGYVLDNNLEYSKVVLRFALERQVPLVYASSAAVYGGGSVFSEHPDNERPLNVYGESKLRFDQHVRQLSGVTSTVVGLRYFNVYGPGEGHKGKMASMAFQLHNQLTATGQAALFEGSGGRGPGQQRRDFVYVDDIVAANLHFLERPAHQGIYNVGTGRARTFNAMANQLIKLHGGHGALRYVPFPQGLRQRYQSFTEADLGALRGAGGFARPFTELEAGLARYLEWLESRRRV